jgi:hypothetical protein
MPEYNWLSVTVRINNRTTRRIRNRLEVKRATVMLPKPHSDDFERILVLCLRLLVLYPVYNHHEDANAAESQLKLGISRAKTPRPQRSENNGQ